MASNDDTSQVDIGVVLDDATLNTGLQRTAREIQEAVRAARALQEQFAGTVRTVEPLLASVTRLRTELATTPRDQLRQAEADLRAATAALTAARQAASAPLPFAPGSGSGGAGSGGNLPPNPGGVPGDGGAGGGAGGGLFGFQAQIAANYATIGAGITVLRTGLRDIAEFDDRLRQFQAITETTNTEMAGFRDQLLAVASTSRFSVTELAGVSIQLGQIGLSAKGVGQTLKPVLDLAAASGSTLQQSVEAITSILGAFNLEAARSGDVADVFVGALNRTKLGMDQLQLGISYAANVARDSGVSFTELTAALGGMAQAGIKSGSTLGTGLRQFFQEFTAPTDKLKDGLRQVGLSMADVDLRANGLIGVIENLRRAGFGTSEALRSLDLRAASAFSAMLGQIDTIKRLGGDLTLSNAAVEGAARANESLTASLTRFGNVAFGLLDKSLRPMVTGLTSAVDGASALTTAADKLGVVLPIVGTGLGTIAVAAAGLRLGALAASLAPLLAGLANPAVLAIAATGAAIGGAAYLAGIDRAKEALDQVRAVRNEVLSQQQSIETGISGLDQQLGILLERRERLNADPVLRRNTLLEAQKAFGDLGLSISANAASIDELIAAYRRLRTELQSQNTELLQRQFAVTAKELDALVTKGNVDRRSADQRIADALGSNAPEFSDPRFPTAATRGPRSDDAGLARAGLTALKPLLDVIRNPASLGQDDPLGVSRYQQLTGFNRAPALSEPDNAVPRQIADAAEGAGRNDRLRTLLRFGAFESDFDPAAVSSTGARGVFQFTKGTASDFGLSDPTDVAQSALAAIRYFDQIDKTLRAKGLNLSDDNRYVLYNQGETGGSALLANPNRGAIQALMDAGVAAGRARQAITANGGQEADTSAEFTARLLAAFNAKATRADRLVTPTGDALDESEAAGRKARAEAATTEEVNARAIRQKRIALEQRQLARDEQSFTDRLALDKRAVGRTPDLAPARRTIDDLASVRDTELRRERTSDRFASLAPDEQGDQVARIQRSYADRAAKQVEENARAIGEATLKTYREEAERTKARADFLKADETSGKVSADEVQAADAAARQAADRLKLEGQTAAIRAEELALEQQLEQLRDKGLLSETGRAAIQERITELKKREAEYGANANLQRGVEARRDDFGAALSRGSLDFFTSARMIDRKTGEFKTAAQEMAGYWQQAMSGMSGSLANVFQGLATGTIRGKDAFKSFATSILTDMAQIASRAASNEIMKALFGSLLTGSTGAAGGGLLGSIVGAFTGSPAAPGMALGGLVTGGTPNRDSVPRTLMPGEFVLKRSAVDVIGRETLDRMNTMGAGVMAKAPPVEPTRFASSARAETAVYVVDRDQVPPPGPNEIVYAIGDNIQKGGTIRQLIKRVQAGG